MAVADNRVAPTMPQTAAPIGGSFRLLNHFGEAVTPETYRGRYMLIFFGFTHCRKVCPRALARISAALERLGALAEEIQPLYITVDPERDTPPVMRNFLEQNYPRFVGLTGPRDEIDSVRSAYKVFATRAVDEEDPQGYAMPHSALTYLMGRDGRYVAHFLDSVGEEELALRLAKLVQ